MELAVQGEKTGNIQVIPKTDVLKTVTKDMKEMSWEHTEPRRVETVSLCK